MKHSITLQINLAPGDIGYVSYILPHQLRTFTDQVQEIILTVDTKQSRAFRSAVEDYSEKLSALRAFLTRICAENPKVKIDDVDYSARRMAEVASLFGIKSGVPIKACDGSAFYAYLFGISCATSDFVFHIDSDMLFGGGSQNWIEEAVNLLEKSPTIFAAYPFPGPPRFDGRPSPRRLTSLWSDVNFSQSCEPSDLQHGAFVYNEVTTRAFLFDRRRFLSGDFKVPIVRPRFRRLIRSFWIKTHPCLLLEDCLTVMMRKNGYSCVGFLGEGPGMWTLHPRWRSKQFYARLSEIISNVESGLIPVGQRGDFDMNESMVDLSDCFGVTRWARLRKELRLVFSGIAERALGG